MPDDASRRLAHQARSCEHLGSPLYATLLRAAADAVRRGGPDAAFLAASATGGEAGGLRLLAAVHRLVLTRRAPALALHYPSVGGTAGLDGAAVQFLATIAEHRQELATTARLPCQTNEAGRAAALLTGFLAVGRRTGLPLRVLEIGASAGLLLRWDRFRYVSAAHGWSWGEPGSPLVLADRWRPAPPAPMAVEVVERRGCDPAPLDPTSEEGRLALTASVWPDQRARLDRLRAALAVAASVPAVVDRGTVADRLPAWLGESAGGAATVVYQSVVEQYLPAGERGARDAALAAAGARATPAAPLAWVRFEPDRPADPFAQAPFAVRVRTWPGGSDHRVATASPHGDDVDVDAAALAGFVASPPTAG